MKTVTIKQSTLDTLLWAATFAVETLENSAEYLRGIPADAKTRRSLNDRARRWRRAMEAANQPIEEKNK